MEELDDRDQSFTWPLFGALYGSLVIIAVVAVLASDLGASSRSSCRDTGGGHCGWRRSPAG
jgi:hypothetical protein